MLIYLDTNIVQYCATFMEFIFGDSPIGSTIEPKLQKELMALRKLAGLEQLGSWDFAAPPHLIAELHAGKGNLPEAKRMVYKVLEEAWNESVWSRDMQPREEKILEIEQSLAVLKLKDAPDQRHLAEAIALNASWFLTNDREVIQKTNDKEAVQKTDRVLRQMRVCRPSECLEGIAVGLFLR